MGLRVRDVAPGFARLSLMELRDLAVLREFAVGVRAVLAIVLARRRFVRLHKAQVCVRGRAFGVR